MTRLKDTKFDALPIKVNCESRPGHSCPRSTLCMCILSKQCPVSYTRTTPAHKKRSLGSFNQSHGLRARKSNRSALATETTATAMQKQHALRGDTYSGRACASGSGSCAPARAVRAPTRIWVPARSRGSRSPHLWRTAGEEGARGRMVRWRASDGGPKALVRLRSRARWGSRQRMKRRG